MKVGVQKNIKTHGYRVGLEPTAARDDEVRQAIANQVLKKEKP
jgi:alanine dehydrogenase